MQSCTNYPMSQCWSWQALCYHVDTLSMMTDRCIKAARTTQLPAKAMHCCSIIQYSTTGVFPHMLTAPHNRMILQCRSCHSCLSSSKTNTQGPTMQKFIKAGGTGCSSTANPKAASKCSSATAKGRQWCQAVQQFEPSPSSSLMPHSVIMCLARLVACCRSLRAPEVTASRPKTTSSATLPPMHTSMRASICRLLWLNSSLSGTCTTHTHTHNLLQQHL